VSDSLSDTPLRSVGSASDPGVLDRDRLGDFDLDLDGDREAAGLLDFARVGLPVLERAGLPDPLLAGDPADLAGLTDLDFGEPAPDLGEPVLDLGLPLPDFGVLAGEPSDLAEADLLLLLLDSEPLESPVLPSSLLLPILTWMVPLPILTSGNLALL